MRLAVASRPGACSQRPIPRRLIDEGVHSYFETVALDVEATRRLIVEQAPTKLTELDGLRQESERELTRAEVALGRIEGDYIAGKITAEKWTRLEDRLTGEMDAARAQADQLDRPRALIASEVAAFDAEAAMVQELAELRQAVVGEVHEAASLDSLWSVLRRLFSGFELCSDAKPFGSGALQGQGAVWAEREQTPALSSAGEYQLIPVVRYQSVDLGGDYAAGFPPIHRTALSLSDNLCSRLAA